MQLDNKTVLITGGATGIGFAFAEHFLKAGSQVIVCGRREDKLREAKGKYSQIRTYVSDLSVASERAKLIKLVLQDFPKLDVLFNNAGIQNRFHVLKDEANWETRAQEIAINLEAPLHFSQLLIPHLLKQPDPYIVNISSGLAFVPAAFAPIYGATKAAIHSYTMALREQLSKTPIRVVEIAPPAVNTDLGGTGLHTHGVSLEEFTKATVTRLASGELEIGYGFSEKGRRASRDELDEMFKKLSQSANP